MKTLLTFILVTCLTLSLSAQTPGQTVQVNPLQFKIMVIPYIKDGQDLRTVLEADFNKREIINKIKNTFDTRGFTTKDFVATLKEAKDAKIFNTNTQTDVKSAIIEFSGADIYVEVEYNLVNTGSGKIAKIIITAFDAATGNAYSNITCDSRERIGVDDGSLILTALRIPTPSGLRTSETGMNAGVPCLDDFLNILEVKMKDMQEKGRPIKIDFSVSNDAIRNFESQIKTANNKQLSDIIDDWLADNAFKGSFHLQGQTANRLFYDEVRIPVFDDRGRSFRMSKFGQMLTDYLNGIGVTAKRTIKNGGIFITLTN